MWAWEIQRKSCCIAWWGQRPISKAILREGKIMQVSWPAIDKPFTGYPCIFITHLVLFELSLSLACSESSVPVSMASTNLLTVWVHKARSWSGLQSRGGGPGSCRIFCWVVKRCCMTCFCFCFYFIYIYIYIFLILLLLFFSSGQTAPFDCASLYQKIAK